MRSLLRRQIISWGALAPLIFSTATSVSALEKFEFHLIRTTYLERLKKFKSAHVLPIIDIESSYDPQTMDLVAFTRSMDRAGIAMMCLSVDQPGKFVEQGAIWSDHALESFVKYPAYFIPTGNGGNHPAWTKLPQEFLKALEQFIPEHHYPMMGEFEVRHYPSPRQVRRGAFFRDVDLAIDGPLMERVFMLSEKTGVPFQIHYEIEDRLLEPLARMLGKFPQAKVIWCHLAQIRYQQRSTQYGPVMIERWLDQFPNLYFDTAFGDAFSTYPPSGERHARYWANTKDWTDLIAAKPYRFLAALDIGGDRMDRIEEWTRNLRQFLNQLPQPTQEIVAYKSAWKLLFGEELDV